jgi:hypothetical protein
MLGKFFLIFFTFILLTVFFFANRLHEMAHAVPYNREKEKKGP